MKNLKDLVVVVVLNYNSTNDSIKCLEFLKKQNYANYRIVLVDNNSPDKQQLNILLDSYVIEGVEVILSTENKGFSAGNNIGIKKALEWNASWILIVNPDVEIRDENYISKVMKSVENNKNIGLIGTKVITPNGLNQNPLKEISGLTELFWPLVSIFDRVLNKNSYKSIDIKGSCDKLSGCCFFCNAKYFKKNGLLDENVFLYSEEAILAKSLKKSGYVIEYNNEFEVFHMHDYSKKTGDKKNRMKNSILSRKYYVENYSDYNFLLKKLIVFQKKIEIKIRELI